MTTPQRYGEKLNDDTIFFYGYKEPLVKFEGGHGYKGVLSYNKDKDKVQCHICGFAFKSLANHIKTHGLTAFDYKEKVGLDNTTSLIGEGTRLKLLERPRPSYEKNLENLKKAWKIRKSNPNNRKSKTRLEFYNKRGSCPDQLLDKIRNTIKSFGRVPTKEEFSKMNGGRFIGSIERTYGNWCNALAILKKKPEKRTSNFAYTREELLESMRLFYKVNKRTPRNSDMRRGLLPPQSSFSRHFINIQEARAEAGVPILVRVGTCTYKEVLEKDLK